MLPQFRNHIPWFAFLLHLRDMKDLYRVSGSSLIRSYSRDEQEFQAKMCSFPPVVGAEVTFGFSPIRGILVGVMRMPEEILGPQGYQATLEGLEVALQQGARVIGLGALTAPVTGSGLKLLRHMPAGTTLTNGNAYTAAVVRSTVVEVSDALGLGKRARVAVIGCTGSVGVPASYLLAEHGFDLTLVGRNVERVRNLLGDLADRATFVSGFDALRAVDIVLVLTGDPSAQLTPEQVREGSVVIDCAQPANISKSDYETFRQRGVIVVEGGIVRIPGYTCIQDLGLSSPEDTFACLAETYLFAREGIREHSVGRPSADLARRLERIAQRHGVHPRPLAPALNSQQPVIAGG